MMTLFNWFPRRNPTLPQTVNPAQKAARQAQLEVNRHRYQWKNVEKLNEIPMAVEVPYTDQPTLAWYLKAAAALVKVATNELVDKLDGDRDIAQAKRELESVRHEFAPLAEGESWSNKLLFQAKTMASDPRDRVIRAMKQLQTAIEAAPQDNSRAEDLIPYNAIFDTIELPDIAKTFSTDETFARLRVAGPNPTLIARLEQLPAHFPVTEAGFQKVMGADDSLTTALQEKRVFWLDYSALQLLADHTGTWSPTDGTGQTYTKSLAVPMALFAIPKGGESLKPVAIQCGLDPAEYPVVYAEPSESAGAAYWQWQAAKSAVQFADANYHELFVHLARTHLVMEAVTIATYHHLAATHPLCILLVPHCEGTLSINHRATGDLINTGGPIDRVFAANVEFSQQAAGTDRLSFNFHEMMPPNDFAKRQVDDAAVLKDYPYRDDALLIWNVIHDWVETYVQVYYRSDADVANDSELAAWVEFLQTDGRIKGFPAVTNRETLIDVLTMIIFTGSAQHAAVNFPQRTVMSYAPAFAAAIWGGDVNNTSSREEWLQLLPPIAVAKEQLRTLYFLGSVYYRKLGEYRSNDFPYLPWLQDPKIIHRGGSLDQFQTALRKAEEEIKRRNQARKEPYPFLLPSGIPPSINI